MKKYFVALMMLLGMVFVTCFVFGCKKECEHTHCEWVVVNEPTCGEKGTKQYVCQDCDTVIKESYVPKLTSHSYGEWVVVSEVTCTEDGIAHRVCTVCGCEEKTVTKATGHEWGEWTPVSGEAVKCDSEVEVQRVCAVCGESEKEVKYVDHQWGWDEWYPVEGAKCNTICTHYRECTLCGEKHGLQAQFYLHHSYKDGYCIYCNQKEPEAAGQVIEFGAYPQSQVTDETSVTELNKLVLAVPCSGEGTVDGWSSYMAYSEGKALYTVWYQDVTWNSDKYRAVAFRPLEGGEAVDEAVCWYKWESLKWTALENAGDHIVLMCNSIIDAKAMNNGDFDTWAMSDQDYYNNPVPSYKKSDLNVWLNSDFYNWAFSANEKIKVLKEEHWACVGEHYWTVDVEHYTEYVYILDDYTISNPNYRKILTVLKKGLGATDYANKLGCKVKLFDNIGEQTYWASNTCASSYTYGIVAYATPETHTPEIARYVKLGVVPLIVISK